MLGILSNVSFGGMMLISAFGCLPLQGWRGRGLLLGRWRRFLTLGLLVLLFGLAWCLLEWRLFVGDDLRRRGDRPNGRSHFRFLCVVIRSQWIISLCNVSLPISCGVVFFMPSGINWCFPSVLSDFFEAWMLVPLYGCRAVIWKLIPYPLLLGSLDGEKC